MKYVFLVAMLVLCLTSIHAWEDDYRHDDYGHDNYYRDDDYYRTTTEDYYYRPKHHGSYGYNARCYHKHGHGHNSGTSVTTSMGLILMAGSLKYLLG